VIENIKIRGVAINKIKLRMVVLLESYVFRKLGEIFE